MPPRDSSTAAASGRSLPQAPRKTASGRVKRRRRASSAGSFALLDAVVAWGSRDCTTRGRRSSGGNGLPPPPLTPLPLDDWGRCLWGYCRPAG